jgi:DNA mismatch endonuclease (patch repair protein)
MTDRLSPTHRSWNMSRIKGKDTAPELRLRSLLHRAGFRFRLHDRSLPGKPDLVLPKYGATIFAHGCFWHRHHGCAGATTPSTRQDFWLEKLEGNVGRDERNRLALEAAGWAVIVVWECELKSDTAAVLKRISEQLRSAA